MCEEGDPGHQRASARCIGDDGSMASELLDLIETDVAVLHGQARLRGTRISVSVVLDCLAAGMTEDAIRAEYPSLPGNAVRAAIAYGALLAREELHPIEPTRG